MLLVSANREEINMTTLPLGLALVAAATRRAGHEVRLLDLIGAPEPDAAVRREVEAFRPDLVGVSVRNIDDQCRAKTRFLLDQAREVVEAIRSATRVPVVLGGAGYSIFPDSVLDYLQGDFGLRGEGEWAFPAFLDRWARKEELAGFPGLHIRGAGPAAAPAVNRDLDGLPWADLVSWLQADPATPDLWLPMQTRRGCPMACSYCSTPAIEGRLVRKCSPDAAAEVLAGQMQAGIKRFFLTDNTFNLPPSFARSFCQALIQRGLKPMWRCILYPARVDRGLVRLMVEAGCVGVSLGCESGSARMLRALKKRFTLAEVQTTARILAEHHLPAMGFLMLGGPGETRETVEESLGFIENLPLSALKITVGIRIYPETDLARQAVRQGLVEPGDDLLRPRFYLEPDLEDWLPARIREWAADQPQVQF